MITPLTDADLIALIEDARLARTRANIATARAIEAYLRAAFDAAPADEPSPLVFSRALAPGGLLRTLPNPGGLSVGRMSNLRALIAREVTARRPRARVFVLGAVVGRVEDFGVPSYLRDAEAAA